MLAFRFLITCWCISQKKHWKLFLEFIKTAAMKFDEYEEKLDQLKKLVANASTGTPDELARRLNVSERTVRRLVEKLKTRKYEIEFNRKINSYVLKH